MAIASAGADIIGDQALVDRISHEGSGAINFEKLVATKAFQPMLGRVARILGPRGLMPNAKLGTLTDDVADVVKTLKMGRIEFRCEETRATCFLCECVDLLDVLMGCSVIQKASGRLITWGRIPSAVTYCLPSHQ